MAKKVKAPKLEIAQDVLNLIHDFRVADKPTNFDSIVSTALTGRLAAKEATGLSDEMNSNVLRGLPTNTHPTKQQIVLTNLENLAIEHLFDGKFEAPAGPGTPLTPANPDSAVA